MAERNVSRVKFKITVILIVISLFYQPQAQVHSNPINVDPEYIENPDGSIVGPICENGSLAFVGENILFDISFIDNGEVNLKVNASYTFKNKLDTDGMYTILLPFVSSVTQFIMKIGEEEVDYEFGTHLLLLDEFNAYNLTSVIFELQFSASEEKTLEVSYQRVIIKTDILVTPSESVSNPTDGQLLEYYSCKYIISTTEYWGEPLDYANFVYWIHKDSNLIISGIELDGMHKLYTTSDDNPDIYIVKNNNTNWMPTRTYKELSWYYTFDDSNDDSTITIFTSLSPLLIPIVFILILRKRRTT
ncbi:MAG: hypothetical protein ACTSYA_00625 [Candidatus Kariarchaeaceae archaeon]